MSVLKPLRDEVARLEKDKAYIDGIIKENAEKAGYFANKTLRKVHKKIASRNESARQAEKGVLR